MSVRKPGIFEDFCYNTIRAKLELIDQVTATDIYVISFLIDEDNEHEGEFPYPRMEMSYNTYTNFNACVAKQKFGVNETPESLRSSLADIKWNFAYWLQNYLLVIGSTNGWFDKPEPDTEMERNAYAEDMFRHHDGWCTLPEVEQYIAIEAARIRLYEDFIHILIMVSRRLHKDGVINKIFGRPIPIAIHDLEGVFLSAYQSAAANPGGVADEFLDAYIG